jgi:hypothetical protein
MNTNQFLEPVFSVVIITLCVAFCANCNMAPAKRNVSKKDEKGFAVLELFTSEGCSSCPPADKLMARIQQQSHGEAIYILAYHVDYWNRLGWKDRFSDAAYSERQEQYQRWLNQSQIYTPQVIVNGKAEFVGSDETAIRGAIAEELAAKPEATLTLLDNLSNGKLNIQYQTTKEATGRRLLIVLVQKAAQSKVEGGENAVLTLPHVQIVRKFQSEPISVRGDGDVNIALPKGFSAQNWEVIGLVQNQGSGDILAAAKAQLRDTANDRK